MRKKISMIAMVVVVLLFFTQTGQTDQKTIPSEKLKDTVLSYLCQPDFSGEEFWQKLSNTKTNVEMIDIPEGNIYFSISVKDYKEEMIDLICNNPKQIEFGKTERSENYTFSSEDEDKIVLGNYGYYEANRFLFRLPIDNLKIDLSKRIKYQFGKIVYDISIPELYDFVSNKSVYGGYTNVLRYFKDNTAIIFSNHGVFVAKKGEVSLENLASRIIAGATSKESRAQKLLDFVTKEITFDHAEALSGSEFLRRPNEILMTKKSDCSGKAILYASLLEQADIDYRLLYMGNSSVNHISVAVEGDYVNLNNLEFGLGTKKYSIAETTAKGFIIGKTIPVVSLKRMQLSSVKYIQKPGENSLILDIKTGKSLEFY